MEGRRERDGGRERGEERGREGVREGRGRKKGRKRWREEERQGGRMKGRKRGKNEDIWMAKGEERRQWRMSHPACITPKPLTRPAAVWHGTTCFAVMRSTTDAEVNDSYTRWQRRFCRSRLRATLWYHLLHLHLIANRRWSLRRYRCCRSATDAEAANTAVLCQRPLSPTKKQLRARARASCNVHASPQWCARLRHRPVIERGLRGSAKFYTTMASLCTKRRRAGVIARRRNACV